MKINNNQTECPDEKQLLKILIYHKYEVMFFIMQTKIDDTHYKQSCHRPIKRREWQWQ